MRLKWAGRGWRFEPQRHRDTEKTEDGMKHEGPKPIAVRRAALLVVDAQCGFTTLCPDELPVPGGLEIVPHVNRLLELPWGRIDASQDWHPRNHCSFFGERDNLYPPHCVQNTPGADFLPGLYTARFRAIWRKGFDRDRDAYAVTAQHPGFPALLSAEKIDTVVVCGLATNICCFYAARDLRQAGFRLFMIEDASAGIDVPTAGLYQAAAREEGMALGIEYVSTAALTFRDAYAPVALHLVLDCLHRVHRVARHGRLVTVELLRVLLVRHQAEELVIAGRRLVRAVRGNAVLLEPVEQQLQGVGGRASCGAGRGWRGCPLVARRRRTRCTGLADRDRRWSVVPCPFEGARSPGFGIGAGPIRRGGAGSSVCSTPAARSAAVTRGRVGAGSPCASVVAAAGPVVAVNVTPDDAGPPAAGTLRDTGVPAPGPSSGSFATGRTSDPLQPPSASRNNAPASRRPKAGRPRLMRFPLLESCGPDRTS